MNHWSLGGEDEGYDESVQGQGFTENQNQNHSHKDFILLSIGAHSSVPYDTNGESCCLNKQSITRELKPQHSPEARWA